MKRKILGTAMALGMCAMIPFTTAIAANNVLKGDMDGNGKLDDNDVAMLLDISLGKVEPDANALLRGDLTGDGQITIKDVKQLLKEINNYRVVGDVNKDGLINEEDSNLILDISLGKVEPDANMKYRADIDGDGQVTIKDVRQLLNQINNRITLGDVNNDGIINEDDVYLTLDISLRKVEADEKTVLRADMDGDGRVTIKDVKKLLQQVKNPRMVGDVNKDEIIDEADALLIVDIALGKAEADDKLTLRADVDGDGQITIKDARAVLKMINDNFKVGDANKDGKLTQEDVDIMNDIVKGKTNPNYDTTEKKLLYLDYNDDGKFTSADVGKVNLIVKTKGDVNSDGVVNVEDAGAVLDIYKGNIALTDDLLFRGDMNDDGVINVEDAGLILDKYKGLI